MMHPMPNGDWIVYPSIRKKGKQLVDYGETEEGQQKALSIALDKQDYVRFKTKEEALKWSDDLSEQIGKLRNLQHPPQSELVEPAPIAPPPEEQGFALPPSPPPQQMAAI